jgi:hypothetical protein
MPQCSSISYSAFCHNFLCQTEFELAWKRTVARHAYHSQYMSIATLTAYHASTGSPTPPAAHAIHMPLAARCTCRSPCMPLAMHTTHQKNTARDAWQRTTSALHTARSALRVQAAHRSTRTQLAAHAARCALRLLHTLPTHGEQCA